MQAKNNRTLCVTLLLLVQTITIFSQTKQNSYRLSLAAYESNIWSGDTYRPPKPIFWTAKLQINYGVFIGIEKEFINLKKRLSLSYGGSLAVVGTRSPKADSAYILSTHLISKIYFLLFDNAEFFILYSPGGPSYLSKKSFSTTKFSNNFVFQNQLGLGINLKKINDLEILLKIYHFSNGDLFSINGGIDSPLTLGVSLKI